MDLDQVHGPWNWSCGLPERSVSLLQAQQCHYFDSVGCLNFAAEQGTGWYGEIMQVPE